MLNGEKFKNELENLEEIYPICYIAVHKLGLSRNDGECDDTCCQKCEKEAFKWLLEEYKEPILTEEDKKILKDVINVFNSFKKEIADIRKHHICRGCYLYINYIDRGEDVSCIETHTTLPFNGDKLFKGMELNKSYTLEELGL